jgi:RNA polymerase sigma factor (sigma-70 family)
MQEPASCTAPYSTAADFLRLHYAKVFAWCLQITSNDIHEAEDLIQDAFVLLSNASVSAEDLRNIEGYIYTVLRNLHRSRFERRRRHVPLPILEYDCARLGLSVTDSSSLLIVADQLRRICRFACERKETSRAGSVLILRFFHGYYPTEIAAILLSSRESVEEYLRTIRREACDFLAGTAKTALLNIKAKGTTEGLAAGSALAEETTETLLDELRRYIFDSCSSTCPGSLALARWYRPEAVSPLPVQVLAHIASCPRCLEEVSRLLKLLPLDTRNPSDSAGKQSGSDFTVFSRRSSKKRRRAGSDNLKRLVRVAGDLFEHKPERLLIAVNGQPIAAQPVVGPRSEITLRLRQSAGIDFIEVFSEQDVRLLMISIRELPPDGPFEQSAITRLSGDRELRATFQYTSPWPSVHVLYLSQAPPHLAEAPTPTDGQLQNAEQHWRWTLRRPSWHPVWRWSGATVSLIAMAFYLMEQARYNTAEARSLVAECAAWEDAVRFPTLSVVRQRFDFRERTASGTLHDTVEVWRGAGRYGRFARHLDPSGHVLGTSEEIPLRVGHQANQMWQFDPSAETFAAFTQPQEKLRVFDSGQTSEVEAAQITLSVDNQTRRPVGAVLYSQGLEFEFVETDFDLLPANSSPLATLVGRPPEPKRVVPTTAVDAAPALPTKAELEMAELQARIALHALRADRQDGVQFQQTVDGVTVDILVETRKDQDEIVAALRQAPLVRPRFRVLADFALSAGASASTAATSSPVQQPTRYPPLMEPYLRDQLASAEAVRDVMSAAAGSADDLLHRAFALSRLSGRYPSSAIATLSSGARLEVLRLVEGHLADMEIESNNFRTTVIDLIRPVAATSEPASTSEAGTDWTASAAELLHTANTLHEICSSLFVDKTQPPDGSLATLARRIITLDQQFHAETESLQRNFTAHIAQ